MGKLYVVGLGPGNKEFMTFAAYDALKSSDIIVGYGTYVDLIPEELRNKDLRSTGMGREVERCEMALELATGDKTVSMICSGDSVVYGMAGLIYELSPKYSNVEIIVVAGVTAALSGSAVVGAAVGHDFAVISLSDYLTPRDLIEKRLRNAADSDMVICLYNPASNARPDYLKDACDVLLSILPEDRICAFCENIGRDGQYYVIKSLKELRDTPVTMFTTVFIGSSKTLNIDGHMVTARGYKH